MRDDLHPIRTCMDSPTNRLDVAVISVVTRELS